MKGDGLDCTQATARDYARATGIVLTELLWPTRCSICEAYGSLLCDKCRMTLPFIDQWRACSRCGAPYGMGQCTECNSFMLARLGLERLPFDACVSVSLFNDASARIVRRYKDSGERGLALQMAYMIACVIPPSWLTQGGVVTFVPATTKAVRRRGFDHCEEMGRECAGLLGLRFERLLRAGRAVDQRRLGRKGRFENAHDRFSAELNCVGKDIVLLDDVLTTGATLMAASTVLKRAGAESVRCATFARVY